MAKIVEEQITIKFSKLVKDGTGENTLVLPDELRSTLEQAAQALVDPDIVVELDQ